MTDQTRWGIPQVQSENKARMHERKKAEQNKFMKILILAPKLKIECLKFIDDNSHNKTMGEMQSMLSSAVSEFFKGGK